MRTLPFFNVFIAIVRTALLQALDSWRGYCTRQVRMERSLVSKYPTDPLLHKLIAQYHAGFTPIKPPTLKTIIPFLSDEPCMLIFLKPLAVKA